MNANTLCRTGREFEVLFFGSGVRTQIPVQKRKWKFMSYAEALAQARITQPRFGRNPSQPTAGTMGAWLFEKVKKNLSWHHHKFLKLYVCIGTALDLICGVDAFFELKGPDKPRACRTGEH